ncbi:MAG: SDR family NAD(P)-dependent oxidoreductase, partial [Solirubrobacteraceae bacterium]
VAEQTGYPPELLDMDLDLEADLGIDTVKQAEVFAALRESYGIERDDQLKLRDYPTLRHIAGFIRDKADLPGPGAAPAAPPAPAAADELDATVLDVVAQQTGYPPELLDFDLDLEADLGIDTVKQAEVFAALRESYGIERDDRLSLRDYPTLRHVAGFIRDRAGLTESAPATEPPTPAAQADRTAQADKADEADESRYPRRVPVPVLRPPLELCVPTGVTLGTGTRVVVMPDAGGVATALTRSLKKLGVEVLTITGAPEVQALERTLAEWTASAPVDGVYWLPALDQEGPLSELSADARRAALHARVKLAAVTMRALAGDRVFLVSATRLGGRHGYEAEGATSFFGGAVTGFTKAIAQERPEALVKAVDFGEATAAVVTQTLLDETRQDPGAVEIGYAEDLRWSVALLERPAEHDAQRDPTKETTFLVTGAAGSIVQSIVADLAPAAGGATFHLLDLVGAPDPQDPDVAQFVADHEGLKRALADRIKGAGKRPTPKLIERELARIERARVALDTIGEIERAGGTAHWHQVDLTDSDQVAAAVAAARAASGRIDAVVHCAGLEISHPLTDKPQSEYDLVFDVKAHGYLNLMAALTAGGDGAQAPSTVIVFSSIAGRFGNRGQTDYSAANDLLCKSISHMRRSGVTRGLAIDWTAWAQIGMASRGSIPTIMKAAGIDMLPPSIGSTVVRRELTSAGDGAEVLVAGSLGILTAPRHETGGLDLERAAAALPANSGPMTGRITGFSADGVLSVVTELDPAAQPFLYDHRIDGIPVLPGVMGMEGFAETASALTGGFEVIELDDVELMAPFKFYRDEPRAVVLNARLRDGGGATLVADCELIGRRTLRGSAEQETRHFTGQVRLARQSIAAPKSDVSPAEVDTGEAGVDHDHVYEIYFHGPAYQVLERAWRDNGQVIGSLAADLPHNHEPAEQETKLAPRLIELCFQTAGILEIGTTGRMALPLHIDRVVRYRTTKKPTRLWAVVTPRDGAVDADVVDQSGHVRMRLEGYRTSELPGELDANALASIRTAMNDK